MANASLSTLSEIIDSNSERILAEWTRQQESLTGRVNQGHSAEVREQSREFLAAFREALATDGTAELSSGAWRPLRDFLDNLSRVRARQGFSATETATFVFSLKEVLFNTLRDVSSKDSQAMVEQILASSEILDRLGLYTTESYQRTREEIIARQQQELLELSTPVVKLWDEILALPLIGTLDSARTQVVMESLLQEIVASGAAIAIIDITGVPTVDTLVAQHLLKTVAAARLMGADCIISGIRPQIAQTIVHLGVELNDVTTKATLADAFLVALSRTGQSVRRRETNVPQRNSVTGTFNK